MANYPTTLPSLDVSSVNSTPSVTTHPALHNAVNAEVNAIGAELGTNPSGSFSTLVERLDSVLAVRKSADQSLTSTTLTDVTSMSFAIAVGVDYAFRFILPFTSSGTAGGLGLAITCPALTGYISYRVDIPRLAEPSIGTAPASAMNYVGTGSSSGDAVVADATPIASPTVLIAILEGTLSNASSSGSLQLQFRAETTNTVVIKKGAHGLLYVG